MKTKQELQAKIAKLQAKYDAIPDEPVKTGVIYDNNMPKDGTEAWCLNFRGVASGITFYRSSWADILSAGLLFHDKESAILAGKAREIRHRLAGFCAKAWEDSGKVIDWNDGNQSKHELGYDHDRLDIRILFLYAVEGNGYYLPSDDLTKLKEAFTHDELKLAITGEV